MQKVLLDGMQAHFMNCASEAKATDNVLSDLKAIQSLITEHESLCPASKLACLFQR